MTYFRFNVHTYCTDGLSFICLTDRDFKLEVAYSFLDTVKERFFKKYSLDTIGRSVASGINFAEELKSIMDDTNANPEPDKSKAVISELSDVKNIAADNLSTVGFWLCENR